MELLPGHHSMLCLKTGSARFAVSTRTVLKKSSGSPTCGISPTGSGAPPHLGDILPKGEGKTLSLSLRERVAVGRERGLGSIVLYHWR